LKVVGFPRLVRINQRFPNERLRRKYYRMIRSGKKKNVAVTAVARELACFIWGMMTNNLELRGERPRLTLAS
jgi:hypothetical protein